MDSLIELYLHLGMAPLLATWTAEGTGVFLVVVAGFVAHYVATKVVVRAVHSIIRRTGSTWDDALIENRVLRQLAHLAPALVVYLLAPLALEGHPSILSAAAVAVLVYLIAIGVRTADLFLNAVIDIWNKSEASREISIKSFVQFLKIILYLTAGVFAVSVLLDKSPSYLLGGLTALTAVLLFVFKDPILGLVAGIQLSANRMVARGDWIEMPNYGADGDVLEVALTTVKVQNWDKTITTIPTYALISESFKNWRGMSESGGRRIKRSINIDLNSIRHCDEEMLERFLKIQYIRDHVEGKKKELAEHNQQLQVDLSHLANGRRMTNVGTFRAYVVAYLWNHPKINRDMTFLVRQLAPTEHGLPIEIYVFCNDVAWANYEAVQADIFDHLLAIVPEFELSVFQAPSGNDFRAPAAGESSSRWPWRR